MFGKHLFTSVHDFLDSRPSFVVEKRICRMQLKTVEEHASLVNSYVSITFYLIELPADTAPFANMMELTNQILKGLSEGDEISSRELARQSKTRTSGVSTRTVEISIRGKVNEPVLFQYRFDENVAATKYHGELFTLMFEYCIATRKWKEEEAVLFSKYSLSYKETTPFSGNRFGGRNLKITNKIKERVRKDIKIVINNKATFYRQQGLKFKRRSLHALSISLLFAIFAGGLASIQLYNSIQNPDNVSLQMHVIIKFSNLVIGVCSCLIAIVNLRMSSKLRTLANQFKRIYIEVREVVRRLPDLLVFKDNSTVKIVEEVAQVFAMVNTAEHASFKD